MLRTDIWVAAFVRRHNDIGHICVVSRRGDPIAGQVFIEIDHLNGSLSLYAPAPAGMDDVLDRRFQRRFDHVEQQKITERMQREAEFDPDYWLIGLEMRDGDPGIDIVG